MSTPLGQMLREKRTALGWSLRYAEHVSGVANAHISQVETGAISRPSIVVLAGLAGAYGTPLRELLEAAGHGSDWSLELPGEFTPQRGDDVETWLKRRRGVYPRESVGWRVLDDALDDYRLHADTRTPLAEDVVDPGADRGPLR